MSNRTGATIALGKTNHPDAVQPLLKRINHLDSDINFGVSNALSQLVQYLSLKDAEKIIKKSFSHKNVNLRSTITDVIAQIPVTGINDLLEKTYQNGDRWIKKSARFSLNWRTGTWETLGKIQMATLCVGPPDSAEWVKYTRDIFSNETNMCYLPWAYSPSGLMPHSSNEGWIDLNLNKIGSPDHPVPKSETLVKIPENIFIRIPDFKGKKKLNGRMVMISIREMRRKEGGDMHRAKEFGPWSIINEKSIGTDQTILTLPINKLKDTSHWIQLRLKITNSSNPKDVLFDRNIDVVSPLYL